MVLRLEIMSSDGKQFSLRVGLIFLLVYLFLFCFLNGAGEEEMRGEKAYAKVRKYQDVSRFPLRYLISRKKDPY